MIRKYLRLARGMAYLSGMATLLAGPVFAIDSSNAWSPQSALPNAVPFVQVDKPRFAVGEQVFFWIGIRATGARTPIPEEFQNTCRLTITRPDGTKKVDRVSWPLDGPVGSTWQGGWGLQEAAKPGRYELVFEFAGQQSAPVALLVQRVPQLKKIQAAFVFGSGTSGSPVTFKVRNDSDQTIRFPRISGSSTSVWTHFVGEEDQGSIQTFYPTDKASDGRHASGSTVNFTNFSWKLAGSVPTITLKPHATYTQLFSVEDAVAGARKFGRVAQGPYKVLFGTTLQVLLGEPDGEFCKLEAVRLPVENSASCTVAAL